MIHGAIFHLQILNLESFLPDTKPSSLLSLYLFDISSHIDFDVQEMSYIIFFLSLVKCILSKLSDAVFLEILGLTNGKLLLKSEVLY